MVKPVIHPASGRKSPNFFDGYGKGTSNRNNHKANLVAGSPVVEAQAPAPVVNVNGQNSCTVWDYIDAANKGIKPARPRL